jgi:serine/threonine-protein kinase
MILGSPKYMSPEQVAGKRADHRADLFSLGVVLYEMLTGEAPFLADSIHGIMYQILNFTPPAPSTKNAELPDIVDLIVAKALNKNVEERYQSARDLADDLKNCRDMLMGKQSAPAGVREGGQGEPPAPSATRKQDRLALHKPASGSNPEPEGKGLALAKSFDSYEATLRLAALTGMEQQEINGFSRTQKLAPLPEGADQQPPAAGASPQQDSARATPVTRRSYLHLWILSAIAMSGAVALYLLH